jgi:eukaryotic-like serine/threonine-protein kinase
MATAPARTLVGSVLSGRWRLVRRLGAGGVGEAYAAEHVSNGAPMAIKVLRPEFLSDPLVVARFAEEGRTCTRLIHPNIVRVVECATAEDGAPYLVMDLLEGVPLAAYTHHGERVPIAQAVPILQGILSGLAAAHAQGIVHRDLKPDNVFLVRHPGGTFTIRILDFGIAKVMDAAGGMGSRTRSGVLLGAPAYMSPEQVRGAGDVDQRSDLWSAGVIFYEMITGRVAFPAPTEYARLKAVVSNEPETIERIDPSLAAFGPFVAQALRKNPDHRFPSALEMGRALAAATASDTLRPAAREGPAVPSGTLTRLPQVSSELVFSPDAPSSGTSALAHTAPAALSRSEDASTRRQRPGGTLASPGTPVSAVERPHDVTVAAIGGTLPSKDLPVISSAETSRRRGVPQPVVLLLVAISLAAGVFLGWLLAHST